MGSKRRHNKPRLEAVLNPGPTASGNTVSPLHRRSDHRSSAFTKFLPTTITVGLSIVSSVLLAPVIARVFSRPPDVSVAAQAFSTRNPSCTVMSMYVLPPPDKTLKSLFVEFHLPADVTSMVVTSGENPDMEHSPGMFAVTDVKTSFSMPCSLSSVGFSGAPPHVEARELSDRRSIIVQGSDIDKHSAIGVLVAIAPYAVPYSGQRSPKYDPPIQVWGRATYEAFGQELPATFESRGKWQFNLSQSK